MVEDRPIVLSLALQRFAVPKVRFFHHPFPRVMSDLRADLPQASIGTPEKFTSVASKSTLGAAFLVLNQIGSRALTFAVNQLLFRYLSPGTYGVAAQLELFSVSILYFSRESLRVALQRQWGDNDLPNAEKENLDAKKADPRGALPEHGHTRRFQEAVNISHIAISIGVPLAIILGWLYVRKADIEVLQTHYIYTSLFIYAIATILELLNEPAYAIAQRQMLYGTRASAEFLGSFTRCLVTSALAVYSNATNHDFGVLPFAMGQLSYAMVLNIVYLLTILPICTQNAVSLFPKEIAHHDRYFLSRFSRPLVTIATTFYGQSIFKQFQTSGDGYLIATLATLPSQGAYALATNYGGLLARVLFQPIEESSRSLFGRLLPSQSERGSKSKSTDTKSIAQAKSHLTIFLHLYLLLALLATTLGPPLSPLLLRTVAGPRWSSTEAPAVLATYCYLIGLLAINGILEAFVTAVATPAQVGRQNLWMAGFSVAFAATGFLVLRVLEMGARGLVVTNAVVMGLRIWWSWSFVQGYLYSVGDQGLEFWEMVPTVGSLAVGVATRWGLGLLLESKGDEAVEVLVQSVALVGLCVLGVVLSERRFLLSILPDAVVERFPRSIRSYRETTAEGKAKKDR